MSVAGALKIEGTGLQTFVTLNDGHKMPMFGLGCFKSQVGDETTECCCIGAEEWLQNDRHRHILQVGIHGRLSTCFMFET